MGNIIGTVYAGQNDPVDRENLMIQKRANCWGKVLEGWHPK